MARAKLDAVYVNPEEKRIVGLVPKETFLAPVLAKARNGATWRCSRHRTRVEEGMVETGESRTPRPEEPIIRIYYKLVRRFILGLSRHRRRNLERPSR